MSSISPPNAPNLIRALSTLAILGAWILVAGNVIASIIVPGHDWIADTVSDLGAGRYEIVQDVTLYAYAAAATAVALCLAHVHPGQKGWSVAILMQAFLSVCVTVIAARNEYGEGDSEGVVVHIYVVYAMGAAYVAGFAASGVAFGPAAPRLSRFSWICSGIWAAGAPAFFLMPTDYDGAFERALGLVSVVWTSAVAVWFWRLSRARTRAL